MHTFFCLYVWQYIKRGGTAPSVATSKVDFSDFTVEISTINFGDVDVRRLRQAATLDFVQGPSTTTWVLRSASTRSVQYSCRFRRRKARYPRRYALLVSVVASTTTAVSLNIRDDNG